MTHPCQATSGSGKPCRNPAMVGGTVCKMHGGNAPQVRAKAAVRAAVIQWGLTEAHEDPGEVLLRLVSQSARRAQAYSDELQRDYDASGHLGATLIRQAALVDLEATERDRCASFASKAIAAGIAERTVRIAEQQGALIADVFRKMLDDPSLGLTREQREAGRQIVAKHLQLTA